MSDRLERGLVVLLAPHGRQRRRRGGDTAAVPLRLGHYRRCVQALLDPRVRVH